MDKIFNTKFSLFQVHSIEKQFLQIIRKEIYGPLMSIDKFNQSAMHVEQNTIIIISDTKELNDEIAQKIKNGQFICMLTVTQEQDNKLCVTPQTILSQKKLDQLKDNIQHIINQALNKPENKALCMSCGNIDMAQNIYQELEKNFGVILLIKQQGINIKISNQGLEKITPAQIIHIVNDVMKQQAKIERSN